MKGAISPSSKNETSHVYVSGQNMLSKSDVEAGNMLAMLPLASSIAERLSYSEFSICYFFQYIITSFGRIPSILDNKVTTVV